MQFQPIMSSFSSKQQEFWLWWTFTVHASSYMIGRPNAFFWYILVYGCNPLMVPHSCLTISSLHKSFKNPWNVYFIAQIRICSTSSPRRHSRLYVALFWALPTSQIIVVVRLDWEVSHMVGNFKHKLRIYVSRYQVSKLEFEMHNIRLNWAVVESVMCTTSIGYKLFSREVSGRSFWMVGYLAPPLADHTLEYLDWEERYEF